MKKLFQSIKFRLRMFTLQVGPILLSIALSFLSITLMGIALLILSSVSVLGGAMWVVLMVYLGGLAALVAFIHHRRDLRELRCLVGDEEFFNFKMYPAEKRREERKKQRKGIAKS